MVAAGHPHHRRAEGVRHDLRDHPGRARAPRRETINIFLYLQAFAFYNIGYASAVVVMFFVIIIALALRAAVDPAARVTT